MNLRLIDWIWRVRGALPVPDQNVAADSAQSAALARLELLFHQANTTYEVSGATLTFTKFDQAAQDKMSIYDRGTLWLERGEEGMVLRYDLFSRALVACFLAPLFFLAMAQFTISFGKVEDKGDDARTEASAEAGEPAKPKEKRELNPIDKALGAPEPEDPDKKKKDAQARDEDDGKPDPTSSFVFAGIFAVLYGAGRLLEAWLLRRLFRRQLATDDQQAKAEAA